MAEDPSVTYRKAGHVVSVRSEVLEMEGGKIRFRHEMRNDEAGEVAAVTTLLGVHMDTQARKSCHFPAELIERGRLETVRASQAGL